MLLENGSFFQILRMLVIIVGALGMLASINVFKPEFKRNMLIWSAYIGYCAILCIFLIPELGLYKFIRLSAIIITIPGILLLYLTADVPLSQYIFTASTQLIFAAYLTSGVTLINNRSGSSPIVCILSLLFAYITVILLESIFLRRIYLRLISIIKQGWWLLSVIPCALLLLVLSFARYPQHYTLNRSGIVLVCALGIVIIIIYCAIYYFLKVTDELSMQEQNREILDLQIQNIKKSTADSIRKAELAKKERQASFALLTNIAGLAREEKWEAIIEAVNKEIVKNDLSVSDSYCSDPILNATLNSYFGRAKNSGITVENRINIPKELPSCSTEFSICLANALENAIKACEKLPKNERRIIVKCIGNPKLMFEVKNTCKGNITFSKDEIPMSDSSGHGIGTRSIIAFCEKHDALYSFKSEGGWFQVTVVM